LRKLYFKLVLAIWAVMIISSAGVIAVIKMVAPDDFGGPRQPDRPSPQPSVDQILPTIVDRAIFETKGLGEKGLIEWFQNDALLGRSTFILQDDAEQRLTQRGPRERIETLKSMNPAEESDVRNIEFEHDGKQYTLSVYLPDLPLPAFRRPGPWQRAVAMFAFRPGNVWLILVIAIPLSVLLSVIIGRYLVMPLRSLEDASQQLAAGDLSIRVRPTLGKRGDEIANFAGTFDQMAAQIETLIRSHKDLLRDVSHELRSPLARVHAALSLARQRTKGAVDVEIDRIELELERLNSLIEKLLTFSRLDAKQTRLEKESLDIGDVLVDVVNDSNIEARAEDKQIILPEVSGFQTVGDVGLLASCFENIIRNAVHYTPPQTSVEIAVRRLAGIPELCEVAVRDHGDGVAEADLGRIFDPFFKSVHSERASLPGAGIGLAIAKKAVALHGGEILARNADGGGLIVTVLLPLVS
jgi:signal transduction histidine kinase